MRRIFPYLLGAVAATALCTGASAADQPPPDQGRPQTVPPAAQEQNTGSSLSGRLDRNNGVIHPPAGIDPGAVRAPPASSGRGTPVIPPPGSAGAGDDSIRPK